MEGCEGEETRPLSIPGDIPAIEEKIVALEAAFVVLDPFVAFLDGKLSANSDAEVRKCLSVVSAVAERTGATFLLVRHLNKKAGLSAMYRGGGSIGITGAARAVFVVGADPEDPDRRVLAPVKCNLGPEPPSLAFRIESVGVTSRVVWGEACGLTAGELLAGPPKATGQQERAEEIIAQELAKGPRGSNEVLGACTAEGISQRTYDRARKALGVRSEKTDFDGQWMLSL